MKTVLFALLIVNLFDALVMPILTAKCRKEPLLDGENTWLPFAGAYKLFLWVELSLMALVGDLTQANLAVIILLVMPFMLDLMALVMAVKDNYTYTITHPVTGTKDDILRLHEHRFYPVHEFSPKFFLFGLQDNAFRYLADVTVVVAIIKTLHFL